MGRLDRHGAEMAHGRLSQPKTGAGPDLAQRLFRWATATLWLETALIAGVVVAPHLGLDLHWGARTTPYRLLQRPDLAWALAVLLTLGLLWLHWAPVPRLVRYAGALVFGGVLWGVALVSMWTWDPGLGLPLVMAANMLLTASVQGLRGLLAPLD